MADTNTKKMLQFKMGLHDALPTSGKAGTVYVTTDEKAMYVDISDTDRIRLGDIIQVESVDELSSYDPDYSTSALYYIINKNALLKYNGVKDGKHDWKQINTVSDVQIAVDELAGTVREHTEAITSLNETVNGTEANNGNDGLVKRVTTLEGEMDKAEGRLTATEGVANTAKDTIGSSTDEASETGTLYARIAANKTATQAVKNDLQTLSGNFDTLNNTVTNEKTGLVKRVTTLEGEMDEAERRLTATEGVANNAKTAIGETSEDAEGAGSLYARIASTRTSIGTVKTDLQTLSGNFATLNNTVTNTDNGLVKQVTDLRTDLGTKDDGKDVDSAFGRIANLRVDLNTLGRDVDTLSGKHNTLEGRVNTIDGTLEEVQDAIVENAEGIEALQKAIGDGTGTESLTSRLNTVETWKEKVSGVVGDANGGLVKDVADLKGNVEALQAKDTQLAKDIKTNTDAIAGVADRVTDLEGTVGNASKGLVKDVADLKNADTQINGKIDGLTTRITTAEGTIAGHTTSIEALQKDVRANTNAIAKLNGKETEEGSVAYQVKQAKDALSAEIDADINAANAMTYKGGVDSYSALPTSGVRIGDTYVLTEKNGQYNPGDFFIASDKENSEENGVITGTVTWSHVKTGYDAKLESKLTGANNQLLLTSHTGEKDGDLGAISFTAQGSATVAVADNQVTIGMAWGEF